LIFYEAYGNIELTAKGIDVAKTIVKKQDILKLFLVQMLGVDEETAGKEATNMKHAVSEETISKLENYIIKTLGLDDLKCNYDLANNKCQNCIRIKSKAGK